MTYITVLLVRCNALSPSLELVSYADDATVLFSVDRTELDAGIRTFNLLLEHIQYTFGSFRLLVNASKTKLLLFRSRASTPHRFRSMSF